MKRMMTALLLVSLLLVLGSASAFADKPLPTPPEFRTAVHNFDLGCGMATASTTALFRYEVCECIGPCTSPGKLVACDLLDAVIAPGDVGKIIRWSERMPAFAPITTRLTDGNDSFIDYGYGSTTFPACATGMEEIDYFRGQAGANGIDLAGATISSISLQFSTISIQQSPAFPWTDLRFVGNVSYNRPATREACINGGWQTVVRSNGTTFKNQGDCVSFVNTGK